MTSLLPVKAPQGLRPILQILQCSDIPVGVDYTTNVSATLKQQWPPFFTGAITAYEQDGGDVASLYHVVHLCLNLMSMVIGGDFCCAIHSQCIL